MLGTTVVGVLAAAGEVHGELAESAVELPIPAWSVGVLTLTILISLLLVTYSFRHVANRR